MTAVFIAGSISIKHIVDEVKVRIDNMINSGFDILIGDANGVDAGHSAAVEHEATSCDVGRVRPTSGHVAAAC